MDAGYFCCFFQFVITVCWFCLTVGKVTCATHASQEISNKVVDKSSIGRCVGSDWIGLSITKALCGSDCAHTSQNQTVICENRNQNLLNKSIRLHTIIGIWQTFAFIVRFKSNDDALMQLRKCAMNLKLKLKWKRNKIEENKWIHRLCGFPKESYAYLKIKAQKFRCRERNVPKIESKQCQWLSNGCSKLLNIARQIHTMHNPWRILA